MKAVRLRTMAIGKSRKMSVTLSTSGEVTKEITEECLSPIKKISLVEEINMVEEMKETSLLKTGSD